MMRRSNDLLSRECGLSGVILPKDCLLYICIQLDLLDIARFSSASKYLRIVIINDLLPAYMEHAKSFPFNTNKLVLQNLSLIEKLTFLRLSYAFQVISELAESHSSAEKRLAWHGKVPGKVPIC